MSKLSSNGVHDGSIDDAANSELAAVTRPDAVSRLALAAIATGNGALWGLMALIFVDTLGHQFVVSFAMLVFVATSMLLVLFSIADAGAGSAAGARVTSLIAPSA